MYKIYNAFNELIQALTKSANANSMLVCLHMIKGEVDIGKNILRHLKAGSFQHEVILEDFKRGYYNYVERCFTENNILCLPRAGLLYNGIDVLDYQEISRNDFKMHLIDLMCIGNIYNQPYHRISKQTVHLLIDELFVQITLVHSDWTVYLFKPNFLYTVSDAEDLGYTVQGYFEDFGRDLAIAIQIEEWIYVLLVNGYGCGEYVE